jgi:hypothetical protein
MVVAEAEQLSERLSSVISYVLLCFFFLSSLCSSPFIFWCIFLPSGFLFLSIPLVSPLPFYVFFFVFGWMSDLL